MGDLESTSHFIYKSSRVRQLQTNKSVISPHLSLDEKDEICEKCPPTHGGYPPWARQSATKKCRHRYTGNWICSVPCDNKDDLCLGFEDEIGVPCGVSQWVTILPIAVIAMIALSLTIYDLWSLRGHQLLRGVKKASLSLLASASSSLQECLLITSGEYEQGIRGHQEFKEALLNLVTSVQIFV